MRSAGTIRRVRQTLLATNLAEGALVAWKAPPEKLEAAFDYMFRRDPFSGHVVLRSTDSQSAGSEYKLWTTVKIPHGFSIERHLNILLQEVSGEKFILMPAKGIFKLGVGHVRRKTIQPGSLVYRPARNDSTQIVKLNDLRMAGFDILEEGVYCSRGHREPMEKSRRRGGSGFGDVSFSGREPRQTKSSGDFRHFWNTLSLQPEEFA